MRLITLLNFLDVSIGKLVSVGGGGGGSACTLMTGVLRELLAACYDTDVLKLLIGKLVSGGGGPYRRIVHARRMLFDTTGVVQSCPNPRPLLTPPPPTHNYPRQCLFLSPLSFIRVSASASDATGAVKSFSNPPSVLNPPRTHPTHLSSPTRTPVSLSPTPIH